VAGLTISKSAVRVPEERNDLEEIGVLEWSDSGEEGAGGASLPQGQLREMLGAGSRGMLPTGAPVVSDNLLDFKDNKDERI
jgi:hypothetical protein